MFIVYTFVLCVVAVEACRTPSRKSTDWAASGFRSPPCYHYYY